MIAVAMKQAAVLALSWDVLARCPAELSSLALMLAPLAQMLHALLLQMASCWAQPGCELEHLPQHWLQATCSHQDLMLAALRPQLVLRLLMAAGLPTR